MQKLLFVVVLLLAFCYCSKKTPSQYATFSYDETYCANAWKTGANDNTTVKNVVAYLDSMQLYVANIYIKKESLGDGCKACNCKTGRKIYVTTFDTEEIKTKYKTIGFN